VTTAVTYDPLSLPADFQQEKPAGVHGREGAERSHGIHMVGPIVEVIQIQKT